MEDYYGEDIEMLAISGSINAGFVCYIRDESSTGRHA
jgi:hypothetical protein